MVDVQTALAAARADGARGQRPKENDPDKEKERLRRLPLDQAIEPFDPSTHVAKEKADTASMWLVIGMGVGVGLIFRYGMMPIVDREAGMLWILPLLLAFALPSVHRLVMPASFVEHYGRGTWFRATFLYVFSWLAISFLLANPPFADLAAPEPVGWTIVTLTDDGHLDQLPLNATKDGGRTLIVELPAGQTTTNGSAWLLFGMRDNAGLDEMTLRMSLGGGAAGNGSELTPSDDVPSAWQDELSTGWERRLLDVEEDSLWHVELGVLSEGTWVLIGEAEEPGDPWPNERSWTWTIIVRQAQV